MKGAKLILPRGSVVKKHEFRVILIIAVCWIVVDFLLFVIRKYSNVLPVKYSDPNVDTLETILLREVNVLWHRLLRDSHRG